MVYFNGSSLFPAVYGKIIASCRGDMGIDTIKNCAAVYEKHGTRHPAVCGRPREIPTPSTSATKIMGDELYQYSSARIGLMAMPKWKKTLIILLVLLIVLLLLIVLVAFFSGDQPFQYPAFL